MNSLSKNFNILMRNTIKYSSLYNFKNIGSRYIIDKNIRSIIASPYKGIVLPNCSITEYVWKNLDQWSNKTALVSAETGDEIKYGELYKMSMTFGATLKKKLKFSDGDVVVIMLPNVPEYAVAVFGTLQAGCVVSTINPLYTADEVSRQLELSDARLVLTTVENYAVAREAIEKLEKQVQIMLLAADGESIYENTLRFTEFSKDFSTDIIMTRTNKPDDLAFLPYSSGTTGLPKGVELTHGNILANCEQITEPSIQTILPTTKIFQDTMVAILPFYHIYGLTTLIISKLAAGCKLVTMKKFAPNLFLETQERFKSTVFFVAPPLVGDAFSGGNLMQDCLFTTAYSLSSTTTLFLGGHPSVKREHFDSMRIIVNGAAPLGASDVHRILSKAKKEDLSIIQGYGLTETSPAIAMQEIGSTKYASVGYPVPSTDVKIVSLDDSNKILGAYQEGELYIRGPQVMRGYRNNPEANSEVFSNGWFRTGDLAYYDDTEALYITDRVKELIKVKGYQVAPAELEAILRVHPSIADVAVIGIPHPKDGETPKAFIVPKAGKEVTEQEIKEFLRKKVAAYKIVTSIQYIEAIPKSAAGKILRRELRKL